MRRIWRESVRAGVIVLVSASLAAAPALVGAQSQSGSDQVSNDTKPSGPGAAQTAKAGKTGEGARDVGDRLHDSAKSFGEAILGGIKYAGRKVIGFFDDGRKE